MVISDVHMPDMNGFKLLEHIGLEMDLPVISKYSSFFMKVISSIPEKLLVLFMDLQ